MPPRPGHPTIHITTAGALLHPSAAVSRYPHNPNCTRFGGVSDVAIWPSHLFGCSCVTHLPVCVFLLSSSIITNLIHLPCSHHLVHRCRRLQFRSTRIRSWTFLLAILPHCRTHRAEAPLPPQTHRQATIIPSRRPAEPRGSCEQVQAVRRPSKSRLFYGNLIHRLNLISISDCTVHPAQTFGTQRVLLGVYAYQTE